MDMPNVITIYKELLQFILMGTIIELHLDICFCYGGDCMAYELANTYISHWSWWIQEPASNGKFLVRKWCFNCMWYSVSVEQFLLTIHLKSNPGKFSHSSCQSSSLATLGPRLLLGCTYSITLRSEHMKEYNMQWETRPWEWQRRYPNASPSLWLHAYVNKIEWGRNIQLHKHVSYYTQHATIQKQQSQIHNSPLCPIPSGRGDEIGNNCTAHVCIAWCLASNNSVAYTIYK